MEPSDIILATLLAGAIAAAGVFSLWVVRTVSTAVQAEASRTRTLALLRLLGPGVVASADDPRSVLAWQPLAATARRLFPGESRLLDEAAGGQFPFSSDHLKAAHARWTTDWLAWEGAHDAEFKLRAAALEAELGSAGNTPVGRARLDALQREKLEQYHRRYEDYTRVSRALKELVENRK